MQAKLSEIPSDAPVETSAMQAQSAQLGAQQEGISSPATPGLISHIQPKLMLGQVNDPLEDEADRVADQVTRIPEPQAAVVSPRLSRKCSSCAEEEATQQLQAERDASGAAAGDAPAAVTTLLQSPGRPLEADTRGFMEPRLGHDLSDVRIHTGPLASRSAEAITARAYTVGHNVVFRHGEYAPDTAGGRRLLAHELAHVLQQHPTSPPPRTFRPSQVVAVGSRVQRQDDASPDYQPNTSSPDYQAGYGDAMLGSPQPSPSPGSSGQVLADYTAGFAAGQAVFQQQTTASPPPPAPGLGELVRFPVMDDVVRSPTVEAARQSDWEAGVQDFRERGGWIRWQGSPRDPASGERDDVHGQYVIQEWPAIGAVSDDFNVFPGDAIDPGNPPANDSLTFTVGHYHQHPPLDPSQHRDPANFPVGPSPDHDTPFAYKLGCPGVVRDFTDTSRQVVRDYRYGPDVQEHR